MHECNDCGSRWESPTAADACCDPRFDRGDD